MRTIPSLSFYLILVLAGGNAVAGESDSSGAGFEISWSSIDAGATELGADGWHLSATVGQPDVSIAPMQGGEYQLRNGYWLMPVNSDDHIFVHGFE